MFKKLWMAVMSAITFALAAGLPVPANATGIPLSGSFLAQYQDPTSVSWYSDVCQPLTADCDSNVLLVGFFGAESEWDGTNLSSRVLALDVSGNAGIVATLSNVFGTFDNYFVNGPGTSGLTFAVDAAGLANVEAYAAGNYTGPAQWHPLEPPPTTNPVPEPETYALLLVGLGTIGFLTRRRRT